MINKEKETKKRKVIKFLFKWVYVTTSFILSNLNFFYFYFQWEEKESTNYYSEKSNGNFKVSCPKKDIKEESETSFKKPKISKQKLLCF